MFISMLQKELKLFSRNKGSLLLMFAFPIILITILGFALEGMMGGDTNFFDNSKVLYYIEDTTYEEGFNGFKNSISEQFDGLIFEETTNINEAQSMVSENKAMCFITATNDGYNYFRNDKSEPQNSKIFRSIFEGVINQYALNNVVAQNDPMLLNKLVNEESDKYINEISVGNRTVSSVDYYTFAELALIILFVSAIVGESVVNEKELGTLNRITLTKASTLKVIFSKITLGVIIATIQIITIYFYSTLILNAQWGNNITPMIFNLICLGIFASVLGAVVGIFLKDGKSLNGILNILIIIMCLFGGSFTPLSMIKSIPILGDLAIISPVYWINSSLISLSTGVKDNYSIVAISLTLGLSLLLLGSYFIINKLKWRNSHA